MSEKFSCKNIFVGTTPYRIEACAYVLFRDFNFRSFYGPRKYFYNENFQIYGIMIINELSSHFIWTPQWFVAISKTAGIHTLHSIHSETKFYRMQATEVMHRAIHSCLLHGRHHLLIGL